MDRLINFFKEKWQDISLLWSIYDHQLYSKSNLVDSILKYLSNFEILDIKYEETKCIDGVWRVIPATSSEDSMWGWVLVGDRDSKQKYIIKFWDANKYYAWMNRGSIYHYPDYLGDPDTFCLMDEWRDAVPSRKTMYKFAKKIREWQKQKQK